MVQSLTWAADGYEAVQYIFLESKTRTLTTVVIKTHYLINLITVIVLIPGAPKSTMFHNCRPMYLETM
jgi:hypothetical protein